MEGSRTLRFAVIGAGMAGVLSAIKLRETGHSDITVYEKADGIGGTWRDNTYPGVACDVPSHLYSYSFELNPSWSHVFSPGAEIRTYFEDVAERHGVHDLIRFGDEVTACTFDDGRWRLETRAGHTDCVDVVIAATGVLHHPRLPDIAGLDTFAGKAFHTARWDHDVSLCDARVGVVGTGSTAVQIVGAVANDVAHLTLFQRTAQWILPQANPPYSEEERTAFVTEPANMRTLHEELSELFAVGFSNAVVDAGSPMMKMIADSCRSNLEDNVSDPDLRERLRPDYRAGCKRLVISPNFYEAMQRPNVELVTDAIRGVEPAGVCTADGRVHELDVLVLATGFRVDAFTRPMAVTGRGGVRLDDAWAKRPSAYLSISVPDFPNFFMLNGPNGPVGNFSLIEVAELQCAYVMELVDALASGRARTVCASHEALARFEADRLEASTNTIWATGCRSWYLDDRGVPAVWPWNFERFRAEMAAPRPDAYEWA